MIDKNSASLRNAQRTLADNTRQIDLPRFEIVRIRAGDFTESEVARIENAKSVLSENGFDNELKLLESSKAQQELLLSHYSENVLAKTRPLLGQGFSRESVKLLGDNWVIGTKWTPNIIYARLMTKAEADAFDATGILMPPDRALGDLVPTFDIDDPKVLRDLAGKSKKQLSEIHKLAGGDGSKKHVRFFRSTTEPTVEQIRLRETGKLKMKEAKFEYGINVEQVKLENLP